MTQRIRRLFSLSEGEAARGLQVAGLFLILTAGIEFGRTGRDGYFLKVAGPDKIPYMYLLNAVFMLLISLVYARIVDRVSRYRMLMGISGFAVAALLVLRFLIPYDFWVTPFLLFPLVESVLLTLLMHFWTVANSVFDPREGKRIFPLLGAAGLLGTILGGLFARLVVPLVGTPNLLLGWVLLLGGGIAFTMRLQGTTPEHSLPAVPVDQPAGTGSFRLLWKEPLLRNLALMTLPMWMVIYMIEYNYYSTMNSLFHDQDQLSGFLAIFAAFCSFCGLLLEMFLAGRLLSKVGVGSTTLTYPFTLTLGSIGLIAFSAFPFLQGDRSLFGGPLLVAFARFCDIAIYFSIYESASQLLFNSLPEERRGQGRALVQGMFMPASAACAGMALLFMIHRGEPAHNIAFVALNLAFLLIVFGLNIGPNYMKAMLRNLNSRDADLQRQALSEFGKMENTETRFVLLQSVSRDAPDAALYSLNMLTRTEDDELVDDLAEIVPRVDARVQAAILGYMEHHAQPAHAAVLVPLMDEPRVRGAALRAFAPVATEKDETMIRAYFDDPDVAVRIEAAAAGLRIRKTVSSRDPAFRILRELALSPDEGTAVRAAEAIGRAPARRWTGVLLRLAAAPNQVIREAAIRAMAFTHEGRIIRFLIRSLDDPALLHLAGESIIGQGRLIVPQLIRELVSGRHTDAVVAEIIRCLGRIGDPGSIQTLSEYLDNRTVPVQDAAIEALLALKHSLLASARGNEDEVFAEAFPVRVREVLLETTHGVSTHIRKNSAILPALRRYGRTTLLLVDALERSNTRRERVAMACLALLHDPALIATAVAQLASGDHRTMAEALEMIEGLGQEGRQVAEALERRYATSPDESAPQLPDEIIRKILIHEQDPTMRAFAAHAAGKLGLEALRSDIEPFVTQDDQFLARNARLALTMLGSQTNRLEANEEHAMSTLMEKILFLRQIPLFEELEGGELERLLGQCESKTLKLDDTLYTQGQESKSVYAVFAGNLKIARQANGPLLGEIHEKETIGEEAAIEPGPRTHTVTAGGDVELLEIPLTDFRKLVQGHPGMAMSIGRALVKRIHKLEEIAGGKA